MDTDNSGVKAWGSAGAGWRGTKRGEIEDIYNTLNNKNKLIKKKENVGRYFTYYQCMECTPVVLHQATSPMLLQTGEFEGCILFFRLICRGTNTWGIGYVLFYE